MRSIVPPVMCRIDFWGILPSFVGPAFVSQYTIEIYRMSGPQLESQPEYQLHVEVTRRRVNPIYFATDISGRHLVTRSIFAQGDRNIGNSESVIPGRVIRHSMCKVLVAFEAWRLVRLDIMLVIFAKMFLGVGDPKVPGAGVYVILHRSQQALMQ